MSTRREALLGRFRARSLERTRRLNLALLELEEGKGGAELKKEVARELHTLKGDSRVVGLDRVSELTHAAEELLLSAPPDRLPGACAQLRSALDVVERVMKQELLDQAADAALVQGRAELLAALAAAGAGGSARPEKMDTAEPSPGEAQPQANSAGASSARGERALPRAETAQSPEGPGRAAPGRGDPVEAQAEPSQPAVAPGRAAAADRWVQVKSERIDELCERVSDFAADFRTLAFQLAAIARTGAAARDLGMRSLVEGVDRCRSRLEDLISSAWSLRLVPVEPALEELVKHARELALTQGKRVRVVVHGEGAEVERSVLDDLWEPFLHLVRNAVDHGVERPESRGDKPKEATLTLEAKSVGPNLVITIADDGCGVDIKAVRDAAVERRIVNRDVMDQLPEREVLEFLFMHGFSTRSSVSEVSGRGVGLDVVRERVDALGGTVTVSSEFGKGTQFELIVPATITKERALVVDCAGVLYGLPSGNVREVVRVADHQVDAVAGGSAIKYRGETLPLRSMAAALGTQEADGEPWAMIIEAGNRRWALGVGRLLGEHELLRRPVDALLAPFTHVAASATLDDGRLVLLVTVAGLVRRSEFGSAVRQAVAATKRARRKVLVVDDSLTVRDLVSELLAEAGWEVQEADNGQSALSSLQSTLPDLVLTDLEMPVMDGFELLRQIRSRWQHLPVVMLTTRGSADDRRQATVLGANAYLVKSEFEEATLVDTVRRVLGASA